MIDLKIKLKNDIELSVTPEGHRVGIGEVHAGRTLLRSGARPMFVEIRSPNGELMTNYRLSSHIQKDGIEVLRFDLDRLDGGPMEFMLHTCRNRVNTADWSQGPVPAPDSWLELQIRPAERAFRGDKYVGFAYRYVYHSPSMPVYKILDRGTWEIGGNAVQNEFWLRNGTVPSVVKFESTEDRYSTEWHLHSIAQPNIFQFFPLQTALCGFTMTHTNDGSLLTWATQVAHVRSLFEKKKGSHVMEHWHEHCDDLSETLTTSWMEVLWSPANGLNHVERINRWEAARESIWADLHSQIGMKVDRLTTYGVLEEWGLPDFDRYTREGVPMLLEAGVKTIMIPSEFENNMNTYGVSNMCCQVDLKVAETVGEDKLRNFCAAVKAGGAIVEMWSNTSIGAMAYILDMKSHDTDRIKQLPREDSIFEVIHRTKQPYVRNLFGGVEADHYTPVFCVLNLREPEIQAYWHKRWKELHDNVGVSGTFVDSSFNLSCDKFHFIQNTDHERAGGATIDQTGLLGILRPDSPPKQEVLTQYHAYLDLMKGMQQYGYAISTEDCGLFNICRTGPDVIERSARAFMWQESYCTFDQRALKEEGLNADDVFFRGLAYRVMWNLYWNVPTGKLSWNHDHPTPETAPTPEQVALLKAFNVVNDAMVHRTVLADEAGVLYDGALWAFKAVSVPLGGTKKVTDLVSGEVFVTDTVAANPRHLYHLEPAG